jgi:hypothetical protein
VLRGPYNAEHVAATCGKGDPHRPIGMNSLTEAACHGRQRRFTQHGYNSIGRPDAKRHPRTTSRQRIEQGR